MWKRHLKHRVERIDWPLVILVLVFLAVAPGGALLGSDAKNVVGMVSRASQATERAAYESAISAAAVKRPRYAVPLETIDPTISMVDVVTFRSRAPREKGREEKGFEDDVWVALPAQLRAACAGAADPIRRLQQALGLPVADAEDRMIFELRVPREKLFRPCVGGGDLAMPQCSTDAPTPLPKDADPESLRKGYERMQFFATQMWRSYRSGFSYASGYPFTGMGWTYDWSKAPDHVGVSEFVIERDATIAIVGTTTPAKFCKSA